MDLLVELLWIKNKAPTSGLVLGQTTEGLAELPQFLGRGVVPRLRLDVQQRRTFGEVVAAEVLDAWLQGTVERGLSSGLSIHEKKEDDGCHEEIPPEAGVTTDLRLYGSWIEKEKIILKFNRQFI